jgi:GT2 family glycosyltransferase
MTGPGAGKVGSTQAVSVVMAVLDGAAYVGASIESVLRQSFPDWELVVVDDGSTDATPAVVGGFATDPRLRFVRQERLGLAAARNRGLSEAGGSLVAFLDADDQWKSDYLEGMVAALREAPQAVIAFAGWQYVDERGAPLPQTVIPFGGDPSRAARELPWRNAIVPSAAVVRADAVRRLGGFDESLEACEDWDLWIRLCAEGTLVGVPSVSTLYRAHAASMTEDVESIERARLRVNAKHHGPAAGSPAAWPEPRRQAVGHTLFVSALGHLRRGNEEAGLSKLRRALEAWPGLAALDELYFELACAYQARGVRGSPDGLDLARSERLVQSLLPLLGGQASWGRACLALGRVALGAQQRRVASRYAREALRWGESRVKVRGLALLAAAIVPVALSRRLGR